MLESKKSNKVTKNTTPHPLPNSEYIDNPNKDYKIIYASKETTDDSEVDIITAESVQSKSEQWMYQALQHFDNGGKQYSVSFNEDSSSTNSSANVTIDDIKNLALNAQNDLSKILRINALIRQASNEDDIIGKVHESVEANLNSNVRISFDGLPTNYDKEMKKKADDEIKRFHKETNINDVMTNAITSTYDEGTCITYLRSKKYKGK